MSWRPAAAWWAAGWLAGTALQLQQPALWPALAYQVACAAALLLLLAGLRWRPAAAGLVLGSALLAFGATGWRAAERLADALPAALEGSDLLLTGVVAQMPRSTALGQRFVFEIEAATHLGQAVRLPRRVSLGWYREPGDDAALDGPSPLLRAGQRWQFMVRLKQPHGAMNPHGFDLELWLFEQGIRAGGTVRAGKGAAPVLLAENAGHPFERARQHVRDSILAHVGDRTAAGVLAALAVGDQGAIERDDWDVFRATGVAHLMSISGVNVPLEPVLRRGTDDRMGSATGLGNRPLLRIPSLQINRRVTATELV